MPRRSDQPRHSDQPRPTTRTRSSLAGAALVITASVVLAGCGGRDDTTSATTGGRTQEVALGHVHGLGIDPGDGTLYVASHLGVFRVSPSQVPERVADRYQDTMGFAVIGPGRFLGSGHPDLRENLPSSLGLIESTDGAETWDPVSLTGDADLHAIEPVGNRIYAFDSHTGSLITTTNRNDWKTISTQPLYDLAAKPEDPATVFATTDVGVLVVSTNGSEPVAVKNAPALTGIDWQLGGPLIGVAPDGAVMTTNDPATGDWDKVGTLDGPAEAIDAISDRWHAATESGIYESTDDGRTWKPVIRING